MAAAGHTPRRRQPQCARQTCRATLPRVDPRACMLCPTIRLQKACRRASGSSRHCEQSQRPRVSDRKRASKKTQPVDLLAVLAVNADWSCHARPQAEIPELQRAVAAGRHDVVFVCFTPHHIKETVGPLQAATPPPRSATKTPRETNSKSSDITDPRGLACQTAQCQPRAARRNLHAMRGKCLPFSVAAFVGRRQRTRPAMPKCWLQAMARRAGEYGEKRTL